MKIAKLALRYSKTYGSIWYDPHASTKVGELQLCHNHDDRTNDTSEYGTTLVAYNEGKFDEDCKACFALS